MSKVNTLTNLAFAGERVYFQGVLRNVSDYYPRQHHDSCNTISAKSTKPATSIILTQRQDDCARLLMQGMKYKEIARELALSTRTVETHINHLKEKLVCRNKTELIIKLSGIY